MAIIDPRYVSHNSTPFVINREEIDARDWRDEELMATDWIVPVTDHPQHAAYLTYRQALRDWPSTEDFPTTRPTLSS